MPARRVTMRSDRVASISDRRSTGNTQKRTNSVKKPNLAENNLPKRLPFVIGSSSGKSYSLTVNLQNVFALLRTHDPQKCRVCSATGLQGHIAPGKRVDCHHGTRTSVSASEELERLEDEYYHLKRDLQTAQNKFERFENANRMDPEEFSQKELQLAKHIQALLNEIDSKGEVLREMKSRTVTDNTAIMKLLGPENLRQHLAGGACSGQSSADHSHRHSTSGARNSQAKRVQNINILRNAQILQRNL